MIHWLGQPGWFGLAHWMLLSIGWFVGFIAVLVYAVMHAATISDEWMEQETVPCPRFMSWEVDDADLIFERIVHRPVEHTVLVGSGER